MTLLAEGLLRLCCVNRFSKVLQVRSRMFDFFSKTFLQTCLGVLRTGSFRKKNGVMGYQEPARSEKKWFNHKANNYGIGRQKAQQALAFVVLKPSQGSGFSCSVPQPARTAQKTCFSHTAFACRRESSPQGTDHDQTWRVSAPLSVESSLPSLRAVGVLCLEVSLRTWGV